MPSSSWFKAPLSSAASHTPLFLHWQRCSLFTQTLRVRNLRRENSPPKALSEEHRPTQTLEFLWLPVKPTLFSLFTKAGRTEKPKLISFFFFVLAG